MTFRRVVAACLLVLAGCGSGDSRAPYAQPPSTTVALAGPESPLVLELDEGLFLRPADPSGQLGADGDVLVSASGSVYPSVLPAGLPLPADQPARAAELLRADGTRELVVVLQRERAPREEMMAYVEAARDGGWRSAMADVAGAEGEGRVLALTVEEPWAGSVVVTPSESGGSTITILALLGAGDPVEPPPGSDEQAATGSGSDAGG